MRVLYVERGKQSLAFHKRLYHSLRDTVQYRDQDGFFEASLATAAEVVPVSLAQAPSAIVSEPHDWLIVNWKQAGFSSSEEREEAVLSVLKSTQAKRALFVGAAQAEYLPPESVLDACDVVFKREPLRDREKYKISPANRNKLVATMISCPFVTLPKDNMLSHVYHMVHTPVQVCSVVEGVNEVGFSGADAAEHSLRRDAWQRIQKEGFSTIGGLQPNPYTKQSIPEDLQGTRFKGRAYRDSLCQAKVNLALPGIGQYTFRHQELLYLGAFVLSDASIRDIELPMPLEENVHYVAFDDLDDMVEKIRYYLNNDAAREKIATAGRKVFNEYYMPKKHGKVLIDSLSQIKTP